MQTLDVTNRTGVSHGSPISRLQPNVSNPAGTARALFGRREGTTPVASYAAAFVSLSPVGGGVLDAPWSYDRRGRLAADVGRDRLHPRHPRCARLASTTQRMQSRGRSPRSISHGRTGVVLHPTPGGRGSPPLRYEWEGFGVQTASSVDRTRGVGDAAPYGRFVYFALRHITKGHSPRTIWCGRTDVILHPRPGGRGSPPLRLRGKHPHLTHVGINPSVAAQCAATAPLLGEPRVGGDGWPCASVYRGTRRFGATRTRAIYAQSPRGCAGFFRFTLPPAAFCPCAGRGRW